MDNQKLVQELIKQGVLKKEDGDVVIEEASSFGKPAEEVLSARNLADERSIALAKSKVLGIPTKAVKISDISDELLKLVPEETAKTYKVIPLSLDGKTLIVGMVNPEDEKTQEVLRFIAKQKRLNLGAYIITPTDLKKVLHRYSPFESVFQEAIRSLDIKPDKMKQSTRTIGLEDQGGVAAEDAPVIKIVASLIKEAINQHASDIHIEPQKKRLRVRFRLDGNLKEQSSMPVELHQPILSRVKIMSNMKIDETRIPQDGRFRTSVFGRDIDFRVSTFPTPAGEKVALRVLDPEIGLKSLKELGLVGKNQEILSAGMKKPYGMVLITGPTGSGKTTTIYAIMQQLNRVESNIVSLEDPVEYTIDGINQSQVRPEIKYTFASGLRQILRQDPDIIMVGEIRDAETAELAVHAALTGHIVLSTLHTNNAVGVIPRLVDMGIQPFLLPSALNLMVGQRLISRLCQDCKKPQELNQTVSQEIEKQLTGLSEAVQIKYKKPYTAFKAEGCKKCGNGFIGRVALFEVFKMTPELSKIVGEGVGESVIKAESERQGMITLRQDGILKALNGLVSLEEVLRETEA